VDLLVPAVRAVPPWPRRVLAALAALPGPVDAATVAGTAGCPPLQARRALEDLVDRHLVSQPRMGRYALHPVVRDAVLAETAPRLEAAGHGGS
jgi:hypothetical protein